MADGSTIVARQIPQPPVQYPPAGNPVAAPARGVPPGDPGDNTALRPAAAEPKLRVPGPATDIKAAEKQAEENTYALADAQKHFNNLAKLENPIPEEISKAGEAMDVARKEAERTTVLNATAHYENREQKWAIVKLADTELTQLHDGNPYPSRPTVAKLDAAHDRLNRATNDFVESHDSFIHAKILLYEVAGVDIQFFDEGPTRAATEKYPGLVTARGKFDRALHQFFMFRDSKSVAQVETLGKEWHDAWAAARDHEAIDTKLRDACEKGLADADSELEHVNKEMKPR